MPSFSDRVRKVVRDIPCGSVPTYKEAASLAGYPRAYRAVGNILRSNYDKEIPCHRVVRSDGNAGGYNRGSDEKTRILKKEGVRLSPYDRKIGETHAQSHGKTPDDQG